MIGESVEAAEIREIMALLPHRYPFIMIDRIIDIHGEDHALVSRMSRSTSRNSRDTSPKIRLCPAF